MYNPFDKELFQSRRKKLLSHMSLTEWLVDIKEASTKGRVVDVEKHGHLLDVDLAVLLLLKCKSTTGFFEKFFSFFGILIS